MPKKSEVRDNGHGENEALARRESGAVAAVEADMEIAGLDNETRDMLEAAERELAIGFQHTGAKEIAARDEPFKIVDAVYTTMEEEVEYRNTDGSTYKQMEEKPKIVWVLVMQSGDLLTCMQSWRGPRKKFLSWFDNVRANGLRGEIGPVKFKKVKSAKYPEPALIFELQAGYQFKRFPANVTEAVAV